MLLNRYVCALFLLFAFIGTDAQTSFYDLSAKTIDGDSVHFSSFKGKKVMLVNTASKCGYTGQYKQLEELYEKYKAQGFEIVAFPSNDFLNQEPGTNQEIKDFCQKNYGVTFTVMEKVKVKGANQHPVYKWLTQKSENGVMDSKVKWNFQKYLIDENGQLEMMVETKDSPLDEKIIAWIEE